MTVTNGLIIAAILLGPALAVGLMRWWEQRNAGRERKLEIFRALMATRSHTTSWEHVDALNRIDLEFSPRDPVEATVLAAAKHYAEQLGDTDLPAEEWGNRRVETLVDLLLTMATALGYALDREHVRRTCAARIPTI